MTLGNTRRGYRWFWIQKSSDSPSSLNTDDCMPSRLLSGMLFIPVSLRKDANRIHGASHTFIFRSFKKLNTWALSRVPRALPEPPGFLTPGKPPSPSCRQGVGRVKGRTEASWFLMPLDISTHCFSWLPEDDLQHAVPDGGWVGRAPGPALHRADDPESWPFAIPETLLQESGFCFPPLYSRHL